MNKKICPLCRAEMNQYEEGKSDTKAFGYCCSKCEIGFYSYKDKFKLDFIDIKALCPYFGSTDNVMVEDGVTYGCNYCISQCDATIYDTY